MAKLPKAAAGRRRGDKEDAMAKSLLVLLGLVLLAAACTGQHGSGGAATRTATPFDDDDEGDNLQQQRQDALKDAFKVFSDYNPASTDPRALKLAVATVNGAMAPLRPIFKAISKMPETTAAEVRAKEEASAAARELLTRHLGELLPGDSVKITEERL